MLTKSGNENFISIKQHDETLSFEIFITSGAMKNRILRYLEYYQAKGIKTIIQQI
jgi:hypothetical protein